MLIRHTVPVLFLAYDDMIIRFESDLFPVPEGIRLVRQFIHHRIFVAEVYGVTAFSTLLHGKFVISVYELEDCRIQFVKGVKNFIYRGATLVNFTFGTNREYETDFEFCSGGGIGLLVALTGTGRLEAKPKHEAKTGAKLEAERKVKPRKVNVKYLAPKIDSIAEEGIRGGAYPGCQFVVLQNGKTVLDKCYGVHYERTPLPVKPKDLYDLASVTKSTATLMAVMRLYDEGKLDLNQKASYYLPFYRGTDKEDVTVQDLLMHESGLKSWIMFFYQAMDPSTAASPLLVPQRDSAHQGQIDDHTFISTSFEYRPGAVSVVNPTVPRRAAGSDEDNGQTSAWYVFSALGFYPVCPGSGQYAVGSPLFRKVSVALPGGKKLEIRAEGNSPDAPYIESMKVNAKLWSRNYLNYSDLAAGARMEFRMSAEPNLQRGTGAGDRPYSFSN
jgi:hypothetical protein